MTCRVCGSESYCFTWWVNDWGKHLGVETLCVPCACWASGVVDRSPREVVETLMESKRLSFHGRL
jgi:hypothetical protein